MWEEVVWNDRVKHSMNPADPENGSEWRGHLLGREIRQIASSKIDVQYSFVLNKII